MGWLLPEVKSPAGMTQAFTARFGVGVPVIFNLSELAASRSLRSKATAPKAPGPFGPPWIDSPPSGTSGGAGGATVPVLAAFHQPDRMKEAAAAGEAGATVPAPTVAA